MCVVGKIVAGLKSKYSIFSPYIFYMPILHYAFSLHFALAFYPNANKTQTVLPILHLHFLNFIMVNFGSCLGIMKTFSQNVIIISVKQGLELSLTQIPLRF